MTLAFLNHQVDFSSAGAALFVDTSISFGRLQIPYFELFELCCHILNSHLTSTVLVAVLLFPFLFLVN